MTGRLAAILCAAIAGAFTAFFWQQGERFLDANGPTFDECAHIAAGYSYWQTGDFRLNREHPPLLKLWWVLPLVLGERPPYPREVAEASPGDHWKLGAAFLYESGVPPQRLLKPARRMNLALGCGIVLLAGWWARRLWRSRIAGLAACGFAAFDPNLVALSCVLSTDAGFALFAMLSAYLLWEYAANPGRLLLWAAGISLGLMLGAKFSALAMVAGFAAAGFVVVIRGGILALPDAQSARLRLAAQLEQSRLAAQPEQSRLAAQPEQSRLAAQLERFRLALELAFRLMLIALIVVAATYGFVQFDEWGRGLKFQFTRGEHGDGRFYLDGELSKAGWFHYFLAVLAVKLPLGLIAAGLLSLGGRGNGRFAFFAIPPVIFFAAASVARVDLGIRVVLPAVVFLYVLAGGLAAPGPFRCLRTGLLAACLAGSGISAWNAGSDSIGYLNAIGRRHPNLVADSNIDWGQGLPRLNEYLRREGIEVVYLSFFGTDRPETYGIRFQPLPGYGRIGPAGGEAISRAAPRHVLAISVNNLHGIYLNDSEAFAFLQSRPPTARLSGGILIFDLTGDAEAIDRVLSLTVH